MTFKLHQSRFRTLRPGDKDFVLKDGVMVAHRAGFEILPGCPPSYHKIITECISCGWLKPVATVYDYEQVFDTLAN